MSNVETNKVEDEAIEPSSDKAPATGREVLSLARYAFVTAALSEGHTLPEILEREGLSEDSWAAAEDRWIEALDESAETDLALHDEFSKALAAARAQFARRVPPLDTDAAAFLTFQRQLGAAPRPLPFLREHGLYFGDWVRLQEMWAERFAADGEARAAAGRALAQTDPTALPLIEPGPRVWPSRAHPQNPTPRMVVNATHESTKEDVEWGLSSLRGEGAANFGPGVDTDLGFAAHANQPTLAQAPPKTPALDADRLPSFMRRAVQQASLAIEKSKSARIANAPSPTTVTLHTADLVALDAQPLKKVLPFERALTSPSKIEAPAAPAVTDQGESSHPFGRTLDGTEATAMAVLGRLAAPLPFMPNPPAAPAVPPRTPGPPASPVSTATSQSATPLGSTKTNANELTLAQYALLCAELTAFPHATEEVFARFGLEDPLTRTQADLLWRERLRNDPTLFARWRTLFDRHASRIKR